MGSIFNFSNILISGNKIFEGILPSAGGSNLGYMRYVCPFKNSTTVNERPVLFYLEISVNDVCNNKQFHNYFIL